MNAYLLQLWDFITVNHDALSVTLTIPGVLFGLVSLVFSFFSVHVSRKALRATRPLLKITNDKTMDTFQPGGTATNGSIHFENIGSSVANAIQVKVYKSLISRFVFRKVHLGFESRAKTLSPNQEIYLHITFGGELKQFSDLNDFYLYYYEPTNGSTWSGGQANPRGPDKKIKWFVRISYRDLQGGRYSTKVCFLGRVVKKIIEK